MLFHVSQGPHREQMNIYRKGQPHRLYKSSVLFPCNFVSNKFKRIHNPSFKKYVHRRCAKQTNARFRPTRSKQQRTRLYME
ncbi:hypothetical protein VTN49DRAFT_4680 [Thermomyces lanuginosus]|uniref:uncharacterized protein n=1 Tax=Thermomyces lanuginosus TaxID=5541 RepID=UPI0037447A14